MEHNVKNLLTVPANNGDSMEKYLKENYVEIFRTLFPNGETKQKDYTRKNKAPKFPERNLAVNFTETEKKRYLGAICWYEYQVKEEIVSANKHFDAVIVSLSGEQPFVLVCEATRNFPEKRNEKTRKIEEDIRRIQNYGKRGKEAVS